MGLFSPPPGWLFLSHWEDRGKPRSCTCDHPTRDTVIFMLLAYFTAPVVADRGSSHCTSGTIYPLTPSSTTGDDKLPSRRRRNQETERGGGGLRRISQNLHSHRLSPVKSRRTPKPEPRSERRRQEEAWGGTGPLSSASCERREKARGWCASTPSVLKQNPLIVWLQKTDLMVLVWLPASLDPSEQLTVIG